MILCLDSGNTRLKWGLRGEDGQWLAHGAVMQAALVDLPQQLQPWPAYTRVVGCNVARVQQATATRQTLQHPVEWFAATVAACGVVNRYATPAQLGADRWAALIAVRHLHAGAALVVNAGTATTVDLLNEDGTFCGGIILPGVSLMRAALAQNTAQLPLTDAAYVPLPLDTATAIVGGVLEAQTGAIERMFARLPGKNKHCFLGGGSAGDIAPLLSLPLTRVENLVLQGVAIMATV